MPSQPSEMTPGLIAPCRPRHLPLYQHRRHCYKDALALAQTKMSPTSYSTLTSPGCPPERTEKHKASSRRLLPTRARLDYLCVRFLCSVYQTCLLSKTICTALVVCQHDSDCRSSFLRLRDGTTGPGDSSVSPSMLSKNVPEEKQVAEGASPSPSPHGDIGDGTLQPDGLSDPLVMLS